MTSNATSTAGPVPPLPPPDTFPEKDRVTIHTDGSCIGNPGPGGWAVVICRGKKRRELTGGEDAATSNRMELLAAINALEHLRRPLPVTLCTDSIYVRNGITAWLPDWKARGWKTAAGQPVKNADLWERLELAAARHRVRWVWVKGHAGNPANERADALAKQEARRRAAVAGAA
ncbi:ribonuclease HI [Methyloversatilis universalis]|uniref:ribonuclease HI n=1 Tax=Methyloversatilis universalis TaxID=378211 RepID=UPI0009DB41F3|nr:ribonuclease HI [Methyloversatilis universalis]